MAKKSPRIRWVALTGLVLAFFVAALLIRAWVLSTPDGKYRNDNMAATALCYYEFKNGHVFLTIEGVSSDDCGRYSKSSGKWIWISNTGYTNLLEPALWGIRISTADRSWSQVYPRIF